MYSGHSRRFFLSNCQDSFISQHYNKTKWGGCGLQILIVDAVKYLDHFFGRLLCADRSCRPIATAIGHVCHVFGSALLHSRIRVTISIEICVVSMRHELCVLLLLTYHVFRICKATR